MPRLPSRVGRRPRSCGFGREEMVVMSLRLADIAARQAQDIDTRYHPSAAVRRQLNKVFPTHWSFLLGEIALYGFVVLLITGVYLTLVFDPSMTEVTYHGGYQPLRGVEVSA